MSQQFDLVVIGGGQVVMKRQFVRLNLALKLRVSKNVFTKVNHLWVVHA